MQSHRKIGGAEGSCDACGNPIFGQECHECASDPRQGSDECAPRTRIHRRVVRRDAAERVLGHDEEKFS